MIYYKFFKKLFNFVYFTACFWTKNPYNDIMMYFLQKDGKTPMIQEMNQYLAKFDPTVAAAIDAYDYLYSG